MPQEASITDLCSPGAILTDGQKKLINRCFIKDEYIYFYVLTGTVIPHNEENIPQSKTKEGIEVYYHFGKLHRTDGSVMSNKDDYYFLNGTKVDTVEFLTITKKEFLLHYQ